MKSVTAAEVAALAAWRSLQVGDRVGGIVFNEREICDLRPHRSQTRVLRLLNEVVRLNQELAEPSSRQAGGDVNLDLALDAARRRATHDHLVIVISDLDRAGAETQHLATELAVHNDVLIVATYDPLGATLQSRPGMMAATADNQIALPSDAAFDPAFREVFSKHLDNWQQIFRSLRVPVLPISTAEPPADQLRALFGKQPSSDPA
jgi:uncharacterized protein (DUF58 family)